METAWAWIGVSCLMLVACGGTGGTVPDTGSGLPDTAGLDAPASADAPLEVASPADAVAFEDAPPDAPDAPAPLDAHEPDAVAPDLPTDPPLLPPYVAGPPAELYDCTATAPLPGRLSPVPLGCPLDPTCHERMLVGHRAAGGPSGKIAPENSLLAIRAAIVMGLDGVELDVRHTSDGGLVLMHDGDVDRTTLGTGSVEALTTAEATALVLRPPSHPLVDIPGDFACARVPTLAEALALTRDRVFVDLDTKTDRVDLVVAAIREAGVLEQVFVSVSDPARAAEARAIDPAVRIQIRPDTLADYEAALALFAQPPEIVEIEEGQIGAMAPRLHEDGRKVFANAWSADIGAYATRDTAPYRTLFDAGVDLLQVEFGPLALRALDRWTYGSGVTASR